MDTLLMALSRSGLDRIDEAITDYHASRVPDPHEAMWRTDYTRAHMRRDLAEDRPWPDHPDAIWLRERAREIEQRWTADPAVAPRWAELEDLWIQTGNPFSSFPHSSPEKGLPTMPGEAPPGMDPVTWRSQLQARDLAGHGRWLSTTTTTTDREGTEPMSDITRGQTSDQARETEPPSRYPDLPPRYDDPSLVPMTPAEAHWIFTGQGYTNEYANHMVTALAGANIELTGDNVRGWMRRPENQHALQEQARYRPESGRLQAPTENTVGELHEVESETEQQMRADFMHAESCVARSPEDYDPADSLDYAEYASPWLDGDQRWMHEWVYLSDATQRWRDDHGYAERMLAMHQRALSPIERRSEEQARYIAEHGIERDESGLLTSHYVTRVDDRAASASDDRFIPMTDPEYYSTAESDDERQLRADYVRHIDELNNAAITIDPDGDGDGPVAEGHADAADAIAARWENHESRYWRDVWNHLDGAVTAWQHEPEAMRRVAHVLADHQAHGREVIEPIHDRNYQQAAELTGHGTWDAEPERQSEPARDMPWANAAEINTAAPVPVSSEFARARTAELAQSIPGHAFAGLVNGRGRGQELER